MITTTLLGRSDSTKPQTSDSEGRETTTPGGTLSVLTTTTSAGSEKVVTSDYAKKTTPTESKDTDDGEILLLSVALFRELSCSQD